MAKSAWQKHVGPFLSRAIKQARKSFKSKTAMSPAAKKNVKSLQSKRDDINSRIRKLKGK
ncbi:MAG: hypothetical protein V3T88_08735 [Nitrosomonadaceae bacterium]